MEIEHNFNPHLSLPCYPDNQQLHLIVLPEKKLPAKYHEQVVCNYKISARDHIQLSVNGRDFVRILKLVYRDMSNTYSCRAKRYEKGSKPGLSRDPEFIILLNAINGQQLLTPVNVTREDM